MGLLDSAKQKMGGLLGGGGADNPKLWQYLDQIILGGDIQNTQQAQRARQALDEVAKAYEGAQSFGQPQTMPSAGLMQSPRAVEQGGLLSRQLQADPTLQTTPTFGQTQRPDMATLAPLLAKAAAQGAPIAPYLNINEAEAKERAASEPQVMNTGQAIVSYDPTKRDVSTLYTDPVRGPTAPAGYRFSDGGGLEPIPGGPADLGTIEQKTRARRNDLLKRPPPIRARPKATGAVSYTGLPAGYAPVSR